MALRHGYPKGYAYSAQTGDVRLHTQYDPYNWEKDNEPVLDLLDNQFDLDSRMGTLESFFGDLQNLGIKVVLEDEGSPAVATDYLDMNNYSIRNLMLIPERDGDASSKVYVDLLNDQIVDRLPNAVNTNGDDFQSVAHPLIISRVLGGDENAGYALDIQQDDLYTGTGNMQRYASLRLGKLLNDTTDGADFGLTPIQILSNQIRLGFQNQTGETELLFINDLKDNIGGEYPGIRITSNGGYGLEYRSTPTSPWLRFEHLMNSADFVDLGSSQLIDGFKGFAQNLSVFESGEKGLELSARPANNFIETLDGLHLNPGVDNCIGYLLTYQDAPININASKVRIGFRPDGVYGVSPQLQFYLSSRGEARSSFIEASEFDSKLRWYYYDAFGTLIQNLMIEPQSAPADLVVNTAAITDPFIQAAMAGIVTYLNNLKSTLISTNTLQ